MGHFLDHTWSDNPKDKEKVGPKRNPNKQLIPKKKTHRDDESNLFPIWLSKTMSVSIEARETERAGTPYLLHSLHQGLQLEMMN